MAENKFISELPRATELKNEAQFVIEQDGLNKSVSGEQIKEFVGSVIKDNYTNMAQVTLPANIVGDKNVLTQDMVSSTNTIYKVEKDFEIVENIVLGENSSLSFQGGTIKGEYDIKLNNGYIHNADLSLDSTLSGTLKNTTLESKWFITKEKFLDSINGVSNTSNYEFENVSYSLDKQITFPQSARIVNGNGATINVDNTSLNSNSFLFEGADNVRTEITELTAVAVDREHKLSLTSTTGLNKGDLIIIASQVADSFQGSNLASEVNYVGDILSDTEIVLAEPLYLDYEIGAKVYKTERGSINISNLNMNYVGSVRNDGYGIKINRMQKSVISNVNVIGFRYCINLYYCNKISVLDTICDVVYLDQADQDVYGLYIQNSQDIIVNRGTYTGGNHGIGAGAFSNNPMTLGLHYMNLKALNLRQSFAGMDAHGNTCDFLNITNCVTSGLFYGSRNGVIRDCTLYTANAGNGLINFTAQGELGHIVIDNCKDLAFYSNYLKGTKDISRISILNSTIIGTNLTANEDTANTVDIKFANCQINNGQSLYNFNKLSVDNCEFIKGMNIVNIDTTIISNSIIRASINIGLPANADKVNRYVEFSNNKILSGGAIYFQTTTTECYMIGNIFDNNINGGLNSLATSHIDILVYQNNIAYKRDSPTSFQYKGTIGTLYIDNSAIQKTKVLDVAKVTKVEKLRNPLTLDIVNPIVVLTQAEYDALAVKDADTLYYVKG